MIRPKTRGELKAKLREGVPCEVVVSNVEITNVLLTGWLDFNAFDVCLSDNQGWAVYHPVMGKVDETEYCPHCSNGIDRSEGRFCSTCGGSGVIKYRRCEECPCLTPIAHLEEHVCDD
jgi:hypothetical protein